MNAYAYDVVSVEGFIVEKLELLSQALSAFDRPELLVQSVKLFTDACDVLGLLVNLLGCLLNDLFVEFKCCDYLVSR
jgi:hypothetical protein